jgi:ABC-type lipoprotein release transport system permease subunit
MMPKRFCDKAVLLRRLAWRSLWRQKRRTIISLASIGLGLSFVIYIVAVCEGVLHQVVSDALKMQTGHLTLEHPDYRESPSLALYIPGAPEFQRRLREVPGVVWSKPLIQGQGVAKSGMAAVGIAVMGVDPALERLSSPLPRFLTAGRYLKKGDKNGVVLGSTLARQLQVSPGRKLVLSTNNAQGELVEELVRVEGVFQTGSQELDSYLVQTTLPLARRLFGLPPGSATQVGILLRQVEDQPQVLRVLRGLVKGRPIAVRPWQEVYPDLAAHIRMDRAVNWIFQGLLLVIILFTIFNTLLRSVLERRREFAVLLALGTPPRFLQAQVFLEILFLGLLACALGLALGGSVAAAVQAWGCDVKFLLRGPVNFSGIAVATRVYARVTLPLLLWTTGLVLGGTLLLAVIPLRRINRISLAETLR